MESQIPEKRSKLAGQDINQDINEAKTQQTPQQGRECSWKQIGNKDEFWMFSTTSGVHHFFAFEKCVFKTDEEDLNTKTRRRS